MRGRRVLQLSLTLIGLLVIVLGSGSLWRGCIFNNAIYPVLSLSEVTEVCQLQFPPGAQLVEGRIRRGWVRGAWVVARLPPDRVREFISQPPLNRLRPGEPRSLEWGLLGSDPAQERCRRSAEKVRRQEWASGGDLFEAEGAYRVMIDLDRPSDPVAYVSWCHN